MDEPWLSFLILSEPLCSCSSRTRSSLCCQRRRPFSCSASSSCSCSFCKREESPAQTRAEGRSVRRQPALVLTFMWSWARLSRLSVVFLTESGDRGTCFFSCSRHCLSWARLRCKDDIYCMHSSFHFSTILHVNFNTAEGERIMTCFSPARCEQPCRWEKRRWLCVRPGNHTLLSVSNCHVLSSPVPTTRHLLIFLFAPLVRVIWAQRKNWCIAMFRLCSGQKKRVLKLFETQSLELLVMVGSYSEDCWRFSGFSPWADEWPGGQRRLLSSVPAGHCLVLAPSRTVSAVTSAPYARSLTRILTTDLCACK